MYIYLIDVCGVSIKCEYQNISVYGFKNDILVYMDIKSVTVRKSQSCYISQAYSWFANVIFVSWSGCLHNRHLIAFKKNIYVHCHGQYDRYDDVRYDACVVHIRPGVWFQCGCYHSDSGGESILLLIPNPMSPMSETRTVAFCFNFVCRRR